MTTAGTLQEERPVRPGATKPRGGAPARTLAAVVVLALAGVLLAAVHLTQGTSAVNAADLWNLATGQGSSETAGIVVASRLPRLAAGLLVGAALGAAGAVMQSLARNMLASPDTLAVNAGAHLAIVVAAATGAQLPLFGAAGVAFLGGLGAAAFVLMLSGAGGAGAVRLVLAGSAVALALGSLTTAVLLLFSQETRGLFAWGAGSLGQNGMSGVAQFAPLVAAVIALLMLLARDLDLLALGEDQASVLGINVRRIRVFSVLLTVLLAAAAVTVAGPIGFVGLAAPALVRLASRRLPGLHRHLWLIPVSSLAGVVLVIGSDVALRAMIGAETAVEVPTGVFTSVVGAALLIVLARKARSGAAGREAQGMTMRAGAGPARSAAILAGLTVLLLAAMAVALLLGDTKLLLGDVANWLSGRAGPVVSSVMDSRLPRVAAAVLAGAALALAGTVVQSVTRNPLAEPGIIGVSGGAGLGAVIAIALLPSTGFWGIAAMAGLGAVLASALVFGLAFRGGLETDRLVLIGIGTSVAAAAAITLVITLTDPWNETKALTWLSGSTYGRSFEHLIPDGRGRRRDPAGAGALTPQPGPALPGRRHPAAPGHQRSQDAAGAAGVRGGPDCSRGGGHRRHHVRGLGGAARRPGHLRPQAPVCHPRRGAPGRDPGLRVRRRGTHRDCTVPAARRPARRRHRGAVLPVPAPPQQAFVRFGVRLQRVLPGAPRGGRCAVPGAAAGSPRRPARGGGARGPAPRPSAARSVRALLAGRS